MRHLRQGMAVHAGKLLRRRTAWWVSVSACSILCAIAACYELQDSLVADEDLQASVVDATSRSRRLQYPDDLLIEQPYRERKGGHFIFIHIILIGYALLGLNTVCDIYFTGSLDVMVERWQIKPDVAGATFMAAGGSAPELFTSLIGATITENDVGFGTIVGSAVFNVLFVIGACGFVAPTAIPLTWWPLFRDCTYYIIGLCVLAAFAKTNSSIELFEAAILFFLYLIYCTIMFFNDKLEFKFRGLLSMCFKNIQVVPEPAEEPETEKTELRDAAVAVEEQTPVASFEPAGTCNTLHPGTISQSMNSLYNPANENGHIRVSKRTSKIIKENDKEEPPETKIEIPENEKQPSKRSSNDGEAGGDDKKEGEGNDGEAEAEEEDEDDIEEMMTCPEKPMDKVIWYFSLPIYFPLYWGIPRPTEKMFVFTFLVSLLWIAGFSFFLVWWVEILGELLRIPYIIMAFTLLAAGTSIPDLVSSMAVARAGEGDMAISSSIGSNIFDILVGLPVPWMLKIMVVEGLVEDNWGTVIRIESPYIVFFVILLLFMVAMIVLCIHMLGWKLNKSLGVFMGLLYIVFLVCALYAEIQKPEELKM
eukprot:TRINITY_DN84752_c0_g1_i1.p2 TRINITY_DN84752_c0_g1~~TRINITY_DN84752_c0_g1_i1.p2  ORF type:complete len:591 (+),score=134.79 TRINITY_DN84752_c0_g1_i1:69-1841(+)